MRIRCPNLFRKAGLACAVGLALPAAALAAPTITGPPIVSESAGVATYTVTCGSLLGLPLLSSPAVTISVDPAAEEDGDYGPPEPAQHVCAPGTSEFAVEVPIVNDVLDEVDEKFTVTASGSGGIAGSASAETTISDDDPVASISPLVRVLEGDSATAVADLAVTLASPAVQPTTIGYTTDALTATPGEDFTATTGNLIIPVGQTTGTISIPIVGDTNPEKVEALYVNLTSTDNGSLSATQKQGGIAIFDNDKPPLPSISMPQSVTVKEGNVGSGNVLFEVSLSAPATERAEVSWRTTDWTAETSDYRTAGGKLVFAVGQRTRTISVNVKGDKTDEPDEAFGLVLENPVNATLASKGAFGVITDDDGPKVKIGKARRTAKRLVTTVTCPATATRCTGRLVGKAGELKLGRAKFDLARGQSAKLKLKLSKKARVALAKRGRRGKLTATAADASGAKRVAVRRIKLKKR